MSKNKRIFRVAIIAVAVIGILIYPSSYKIGIDGKILHKKIPVYAKACGFIYRDWAYRDLVKEITGGERDELKRTLAILNWTRNNVRCGVPQGLKCVDDHPLNIIIRQYGAGDQLNDVFTILCSYAGMRAGMEKCYNESRSRHIDLSFVCVKKKWLIFDASKGRYFLNSNNEIASTEDYLNGRVVLTPDDTAAYKDYLDYVKNIDFNSFTRAEEQMPFQRIPAEFKKMLKREKICLK